MNAMIRFHAACPMATDGQIAAINLESSRRAAWARFRQDPCRPGLSEDIVNNERLVLQFLGDLAALDRLEALASQFAQVDHTYRAALVNAEVASAGHRFAEARRHLRCAAKLGAPPETIERHMLAIDQACGVSLDVVLTVRRRIAAATSRLEDLVPLGALLADLEDFVAADKIYRQAFDAYDGVSPLSLAWVCFQLGMLWGELVPAPDLELAALWYRRAITYLPCYTKARVHLAELHTSLNRLADAEALLIATLPSNDPEVRWRLADVLNAQGRFDEAQTQLDSARLGFDILLEKHALAFADHAAEFYAGSGNDLPRALELARANLANRPSRRAMKQAESIRHRLSRDHVQSLSMPTHLGAGIPNRTGID